MCKLTNHSVDRMKERCGCNKSAHQKIAATALEKGITHAQTSGSLKRYLDSLFLKHRTANNLRIWGDKVFVFRGDVLITVLQLPQKYMDTCNKIRAKTKDTKEE